MNSENLGNNEIEKSRCVAMWEFLQLLRSASGDENHNLVISKDHDDGSSTEGWKVRS